MDNTWKKFLNIGIWVAAVILLLRCLISWEEIRSYVESKAFFSASYNLLGYIGEAIALTTILMSLYNKWGWKWKILKWTHNRVVLSPHYSGIIRSDYDNTERKSELRITQTFLSISIKMRTNESSSRSIIATFLNSSDENTLVYSYQNDPHGDIQNRSPVHYGTVIIDASNPYELEGNYFTSRNTKGFMKFTAD